MERINHFNLDPCLHRLVQILSLSILHLLHLHQRLLMVVQGYPQDRLIKRKIRNLRVNLLLSIHSLLSLPQMMS